MKCYNVLFTAKVDCSMTVCLEDNEEPTMGAMFGGVRDRVGKNCHVSDWMEEDDFPVITIDDWTLEKTDES